MNVFNINKDDYFIMEKNMKKIILKISLDKKSSVKIIVEISGNHQNNYRSLKKLVNQAIRNGADIIKFQVSNQNNYLQIE